MRNGLNRLLLLLLLLPLSALSETFKNPQLIPTQSSPFAVIEGDLNGDGKPELIYTDVVGSVSAIHVLLNQGANNYSAGQTFTAAAPKLFGAGDLADVNGDGKPDLVFGLSNVTSAELAVALGNGDGTFQPLLMSALPSYISTSDGPLGIYALKIADMNGDGKPDVIFTDVGNYVGWICLGDGSGHFTQWQELNDENPGFAIYVGDFNRDGKTDIILNELNGARAAVYVNNNNAGFTLAPYVNGPQGIAGFAVKDIDGDGYPDLVITGQDNVLRILHGNADATFTATQSFPVPVGASVMQSIVLKVEDYNHDGILDLALESADGVHILIGQGNFQFVPFQPAPVAGFPGHLGLGAIGDLNQDTYIDFAFPEPGGLAILYGQANGSLRSADSYDTRYVGGGAALADFNGDGRQDAIVSVDDLFPRVLLGNADGTLTFLPDTNTASTATYDQNLITTGDFNGDGHADYVSGVGSTDQSQIQGAVYALGNGDGTFSSLHSVPGQTEYYGVGIAVGDLNNDGRTDLYAGESFSTQQAFFLGQSDGSLKQSTILFSPFDFSYPFAFGDFNKDGHLDAAIVGGGEMQIENGKGDGTFTPGFLYTASASPTLGAPPAVIAVDIDGDGNLDILGPIEFNLQAFYGRGDGTFDAPVYIPLSQPPAPFGSNPYPFDGINSADFNGDGIPDLVLTNGGLVTVIHGLGHRQFGASENFFAGPDTSAPLVADFNGDGRPDIFVNNLGSTVASTVTVLLNIADAGDVAGKLIAIPEPSTFPQPFSIDLTLSAAVAASGIPTGTVSFSLDGALLGAEPINNAVASFIVNTPVAVGTHVLSAAYSGDSTFHAANFTAQHTVVAPAVATQTVLTATPNPSFYGLPVQLTATVVSPTLVQGGSITFMDGAAVLANVALGQAGSATFSTSALQVGTHAISAIYSGASGYQSGASNTLSLLVQPDATATSLTANPNPALVGTNVTFTASVANTIAPGVAPAGNITFYDGTVILGSAALGGNGTAIYTTNSLTVGTHAITASYAGASNTMVSVSAALQQVIVAIVGDFTLDVTPGSASIYTGVAARFKVVVSAVYGFNQTVSLSCSGLPVEATCVFKPVSIAGGNGLTQLTIQTSPPHPLKAAGNSTPLPWKPMAAATAFVSLAILLLPVRMRTFRMPLMLVAVLLLTMTIGACGGPGPAGGGTPPGNYIVSVTGVASPLAHSTSLSLTVKSFF